MAFGIQIIMGSVVTQRIAKQHAVAQARDEATWSDRMAAYAQAFPDLAGELRGSLRGELPFAS